MKRSCSMVLAVVVAFVALAGTAWGQAAPAFKEKVTLKCSLGASIKTYPASVVEQWAKTVNERSGGAITIEFYDNGKLGLEPQIIAQVMDGTIDLALVGMSTFSMYSPMLEVMQIPFLVTSYDLEWKMLQSPEWKALTDEVGKVTGLKFFGSFEHGIRHFALVNKPINTIKDMKGVKIRTAQSAIVQKALKNVGANPVPLAYNEVYTGLQNKLVDGEEINLSSIMNMKHYEVVKYVSRIGMYPFESGFIISQKTVSKLPAGYYDLMASVINEIQQKSFISSIKAEEELALKVLAQKGVKINDIKDPAAFAVANQSLLAEYRAKDPRMAAFIDKALELKMKQ